MAAISVGRRWPSCPTHSPIGEVGGMPRLGQSRKSRLRRHGKEWKKSIHGDLKL